jgi:hypothetical protein
MWVLAKAMWNPESDGKALIDEFLNGYYGPAADSMRKYIDAIHRPVRADPRLNVSCVEMKLEGAPWLTPEVIAEAEVHLREAAKKVEQDPVLSRRMRQAHMPIWYLILKKDPLFAKSGRKSRLRLALESKVGPLDYADIALNFVGAVKENGINATGENKELGQWIEWTADYAKTLKEKGEVLPPELHAKAPIVVHAGAMTVPSMDNPWFKQRLNGLPMGYRKDPSASDGWAYDTGTNEWFVCFFLTPGRDYEPGTKYKLFVRAKGEIKRKEGPGFGCGIQRATAPLSGSFEAKELADGQFHALEVGAIEMDENGGNLWIALSANSSLTKVSLDCFWLVEANAK